MDKKGILRGGEISHWILNGKIVWCKENQLKRYREYNKDKPVFVILGMGENPTSPEFISLMSIKVAKFTGLFRRMLNNMKFNMIK